MSLRVQSGILKAIVRSNVRSLSQYYNINDNAFGFNEQQKEVCS